MIERGARKVAVFRMEHGVGKGLTGNQQQHMRERSRRTAGVPQAGSNTCAESTVLECSAHMASSDVAPMAMRMPTRRVKAFRSHRLVELWCDPKGSQLVYICPAALRLPAPAGSVLSLLLSSVQAAALSASGQPASL